MYVLILYKAHDMTYVDKYLNIFSKCYISTQR